MWRCESRRGRRRSMFGGIGMEHLEVDLQGMFEKDHARSDGKPREMTVTEARKHLVRAGMRRAHRQGQRLERRSSWPRIRASFSSTRSTRLRGRGCGRARRFAARRAARPAADRRRHDRQTRYGIVRTEHILFIAAGAFHDEAYANSCRSFKGDFRFASSCSDLEQRRLRSHPQGAEVVAPSPIHRTDGRRRRQVDVR